MSYLCLTRDIGDGEQKSFESFGDHVIVKKDQGKIIVAKNACKHRGFQVLEDNCTAKGTIKCKYHGQRFGYEQTLKHHEFGEFIFLPRYLTASSVLSKLSESIGEPYGGSQMVVKAPFNLWMQNTMDANHLSTVHGDKFAGNFDNYRPENIYISEFESSFTLRIKDEVREKYAKYGDINSDLFDNGWTHYMGFPNLSVTSFLGIFFSVEHVNPTSQGCEVQTRFFTAKGSQVPSLLLKMAMQENEKVLWEDQKIVGEWAQGYKYNDECDWLPGETRIQAYARQIRDRQLG